MIAPRRTDAQLDPEPAHAYADGPERGEADPTMSIAYRLVCLLFAGGGLWVCWTAAGLTYYSPIGPGPGLFPFWVGVLLTVFAVAALLQSFQQGGPRFAERLLPAAKQLPPVVLTIAAVAGFAIFVERLGFALTMFGVLLVLLLANGSRLFPTALPIALVGSFGVAYAFQAWLGVYLPPAPGGLLHFIGM